MPVVAAHYLEIVDANDEPVCGESEGHDYEDAIDVVGWHWGVSDESSTKSSSGSDSGKGSSNGKEVGIEPSTFTFTKSVDASTTRLMNAMYKNEELKMVTFTLLEELDISEQAARKAEGRRGAFRLHVVLEKVRVIGYQLDGSAADYRVDLNENWELNYSTITFLYETERVEAAFDRNPASQKRASEKHELSFLDELKKYGIVPDQRTKIKAGRT